MDTVQKLLEAALIIHNMEMDGARSGVQSANENMQRCVDAVLDNGNFEISGNGPWNDIFERVKALEDVAEFVQGWAKGNTTKAAQQAQKLLDALDATY